MLASLRPSWSTLLAQFQLTKTVPSTVERCVQLTPFGLSVRCGLQVISRFSTDIQSNGVVYTDSSGRDMIKRVYNFRETWKLEVFEPVAGNYYPVNTAVFINSSDAQLTVLVDRAQGAASLASGMC